jgi:hypothetical protein
LKPNYEAGPRSVGGARLSGHFRTRRGCVVRRHESLRGVKRRERRAPRGLIPRPSDLHFGVRVGSRWAASPGGGWWAQRDLNPRPNDYESPALTAELWAHDAGCEILELGVRHGDPAWRPVEVVSEDPEYGAICQHARPFWPSRDRGQGLSGQPPDRRLRIREAPLRRFHQGQPQAGGSSGGGCERRGSQVQALPLLPARHHPLHPQAGEVKPDLAHRVADFADEFDRLLGQAHPKAAPQ